MPRRTMLSCVTAGILTSLVAGSGFSRVDDPEEAPMPREKGRELPQKTRKVTLQECREIALLQEKTESKTPSVNNSAGGIVPPQPVVVRIKSGLLSQRAQIDVEISYLLVNVEVAYWNLYAAHQNLRAWEKGLVKASEVFRFYQKPVDLGANRDQVPVYMERFRRMAVIEAPGQVLDCERQLRGLLGLKCGDGTLLLPSDEPCLDLQLPDFQAASNEALKHRPEIVKCKTELRAQQLKLESLKAQGQEYLLGDTQLTLARTEIQKRDTELKVLEQLVQQYRQLIVTHADIAPARAEREALQRYIKKIETLVAFGKWNPQDLANYLTVQQQLATALATEAQAIADFKNAQVTFEFAKGTIQKCRDLTGEQK